jgi:hypothetical protein
LRLDFIQSQTPALLKNYELASSSVLCDQENGFRGNSPPKGGEEDGDLRRWLLRRFQLHFLHRQTSLAVSPKRSVTEIFVGSTDRRKLYGRDRNKKITERKIHNE